ncbi:hypothetical protein Mmc1_0185 [Magnetococcus marinus MC-1]|uniref:Uncharacterized protein n=1 Tax=Magnetococcus marinus (strain ATCC BAA-1437 / JCM 17883 / MC-1) TaxID=156889 RepID=A0L419_MAGMM|nr:hypothetical protein [Magnetococcus marinus]ABK42712.1 hypothetical protein Mmc1_0185 [Magnetococcus marinus MC-1]
MKQSARDATTATLFTALSQLDTLRQPRDEHVERPIGYTQLMQYIQGDGPTSLAVVRALKADAKLKASYHQLLQRRAMCYFPAVVAASSGEINERQTDGWKIRWKTSRADANQIYLLIELKPHMERTPTKLTVEEERITLPEPVNGTIQLLVEANCAIMQGLRNKDSKVYLH